MVRDQGNMARAPSLMNYWTAILQHLGRPVIHPRIHMPPCPFVFCCVWNKCTWRHQVFQLICSEICQIVYTTNAQKGKAAVSPKIYIDVIYLFYNGDCSTTAPKWCSCFVFFFLLDTATTKTILNAFIYAEGRDGGTTPSRLCVLLDPRVLQATH